MKNGVRFAIPFLFLAAGCLSAYAEKVTPPVIAAPPAGVEADYGWYVSQFMDHGKFTPIGPAGDPADVAVSANGQIYSSCNLEGYHTGQGLEPLPGVTPNLMPEALAFALYEVGKVILMGQGEPVRQSLMNDCLPIVQSVWKHGSFLIHQTAFAQQLRGGEIITGKERTLAWAALDIINRAKEEKEITLLAFYSGDAANPRPELQFRDGAVFDGDSAILRAAVPAHFSVDFWPVFPAAAEVDQGDPLGLLRSQEGVFNALVIRGKIGSGQTVRVIFNRAFAPQDTVFWEVEAEGPAVTAEELRGKSLERELQIVKQEHARRAGMVSPFETPDLILNNIYTKAMLDGYFLTRRWDKQYIVFDSVIYRCQWDDGCAKWIYALNLMGDHETAGRLLDTIFARQGLNKPTGTRTFEGCFSDYTNTKGDQARDYKLASWTSGPGWALWTMSQHARLYNDRAWLEQHKRQILEGCQWIIRERNFSREKPDNPCAGLIWGRYVCDLKQDTDGYFTYSDAVCHLGLKSAGQLLADWGYPEGPGLLQESQAYRQDILAAVDRLTDRSSDPWYVPWILHRPEFFHRYFYDVCGPINLVTGGLLPADDERIGHIIRWTIDKIHHGSLEHLITGDNNLGNLMGGTCFYSQDLAVALLELGRVDDFLRILYSLTTAAISHQTLTTTEWGPNTQPHIHSISSLIRIIRTMFIEERGDRLYLLQGVPRRWLEQGQEIKIQQAPTIYGPLSLTTQSNLANNRIDISLTLPDRIGAAPVHLKTRLPNGYQINSVAINDKNHLDFEDEWIILKDIEGDLHIAVMISRL